MAQRVGQGGQATVEATFRDGSGALVDPVDPTVSVTDATTAVFVAGAAPTRQSLGVYTYVLAVPLDGALGTWDVRWRGTINGASIVKDDTVEVVAAGVIDVGVPPAPAGETATLVSVPELVRYMSNIKLDEPQLQAAEYVLEGVEAEIRSFLGRPLASGPQVETAYATYDGFIRLGVSPITSVESVTIFDALMDPASYQIVPGGIYMSMPYVSAPGLFVSIGSGTATSGSTEQTGIPITVAYTGGLPAADANQVRLEILRLASTEMQNHHDDTLSIAGQERRPGSRPPVLPYGLDDATRNRLRRLKRRVAV